MIRVIQQHQGLGQTRAGLGFGPVVGSSSSGPTAAQGKAVCSWSPAMPKSHWGRAGGPRVGAGPCAWAGWGALGWARAGRGPNALRAGTG